MAQIYVAKDGTEHEFPDDATPEEIQAAADQLDPVKSNVAEVMANAEKYRAANPVTNEMNGLQKFAAAYGKSYMDTGRGIKQLFGQSSEDEIQRARDVDAALMDTGAGKAGNIAGQAVQIATPLPGAAGTKVAAYTGKAAPFVSSALRSATVAGAQGTVGDESRLGNAAEAGAWGVAGQGVASGLKYAAGAAKQALTAPVRESIKAARAAGIPLNVSQVTNSRMAKTVQSVLNELPFTGAGKAIIKQQQAFNRAVSKSFGENAPEITEKVLASGKAKVGALYDSVFKNATIKLDPADLRQMASIESKALKDLTADKAQVVANQFQKIIDEFGSGPVSGARYQSLRGSLQDAIGEGLDGKLVKQLRTQLDAAAARSVGTAQAAVLKRANGMYANLKTVEKALQQVEGAKGNVKPASLFPLVKNGATREMRELAKIGQNVLKDPIPNSGTAQRQLVTAVLGGSALGIVPAAKLAGLGAVLGKAFNSNTASRLLEQGKPMAGLARVAKPAPRLLPAAASSLDIGMVTKTRAETEADRKRSR